MSSRDYRKLPDSPFSTALDPIAEVNALHHQLDLMDNSHIRPNTADKARRERLQTALDQWKGSRQYAEARAKAQDPLPVDPSPHFWRRPPWSQEPPFLSTTRVEEDHRTPARRYRDYRASQQVVPSLSLHPASPLSSTPVQHRPFEFNVYDPQNRPTSSSSISSGSGSDLSGISGLSLSPEFRGRSRGNSEASEDEEDQSSSGRTMIPTTTKKGITGRLFKRLSPSRRRRSGSNGSQGSFMPGSA